MSIYHKANSGRSSLDAYLDGRRRLRTGRELGFALRTMVLEKFGSFPAAGERFGELTGLNVKNATDLIETCCDNPHSYLFKSSKNAIVRRLNRFARLYQTLCISDDDPLIEKAQKINHSFKYPLD